MTLRTLALVSAISSLLISVAIALALAWLVGGYSR